MWLDSLVEEDLRQPLDYGAMTEDERTRAERAEQLWKDFCVQLIK